MNTELFTAIGFGLVGLVIVALMIVEIIFYKGEIISYKMLWHKATAYFHQKMESVKNSIAPINENYTG